MKYKLLLLLSGLLFCFCTYGQSDIAATASNNIYLELLGNGGVYSINYERLFTKRLALRLGFATWKSNDLFGSGNKSFFTVPVLGNFLFGTGKSKLEAGAGFLFGHQNFKSTFGGSNNTGSSIVDLTGVIGYRYQPAKGGFMFRIGATPFYALSGGNSAYPDKGFYLSGGVSIGYSF